MPAMRSKLNAATTLFGTYAIIKPGQRVLMLNSDDPALARWALDMVAPDGQVTALHSSHRSLATLARVPGLDTAATVYPDPAQHGDADVALLEIPKGREAARAWLWTAAQSVRPGGTLYLAGANAAGAKSAIKDAEALLGSAPVLGHKGGHRLALAQRPDTLALPPAWGDTRPWEPRTVHLTHGGQEVPVVSMPGLFSWNELDEGTALLLDHLVGDTVRAGMDVLDVGCGYGIVGLVAARSGARVTLIDDDLRAVRCARETIRLNGLDDRCTVQPGDVMEGLSGQTFDLVLSNPPFHQGTEVMTATAHQIVRQARDVLKPGGRLLVVANRFLPYDRTITEVFGSARIVAETTRFYVIEGVRGRA